MKYENVANTLHVLCNQTYGKKYKAKRVLKEHRGKKYAVTRVLTQCKQCALMRDAYINTYNNKAY